MLEFTSDRLPAPFPLQDKRAKPGIPTPSGRQFQRQANHNRRENDLHFRGSPTPLPGSTVRRVAGQRQNHHQSVRRIIKNQSPLRILAGLPVLVDLGRCLHCSTFHSLPRRMHSFDWTRTSQSPSWEETKHHYGLSRIVQDTIRSLRIFPWEEEPSCLQVFLATQEVKG